MTQDNRRNVRLMDIEELKRKIIIYSDVFVIIIGLVASKKDNYSVA